MNDSSQVTRVTASMPAQVAERAAEIAKAERRSVSAQLGVWVAEAVDAYDRGDAGVEIVPAQNEPRKRP